jgi:hypothetical protein
MAGAGASGYRDPVNDAVLVPVEVPLVGDPRLKHWAKVVDSVDESRSTGYAYGGAFIAAGGIQDVPAGAVLIVYGERGSRGNPRPEAKLYTVNADGTLSHEQTASGRAWARTLRDRVADLLHGPRPVAAPELAWDEALSRYTTDALLEELDRRGRSVGP